MNVQTSQSARCITTRGMMKLNLIILSQSHHLYLMAFLMQLELKKSHNHGIIIVIIMMNNWEQNEKIYI